VTRVAIRGLGAVSPAGWGVPSLRAALAGNTPIPPGPLGRPGWTEPLWARLVPSPPAPQAFASHPRLRRTSVITRHVLAAALEALGEDAARAQAGALRLAIVVSVMAGAVNYTRRFYEETLADPATASPLIFPETVFNAAASHLAAYLGAEGASCTLVGDEGGFLEALALGANWLCDGRAEACVVVGAEEEDWIVADALGLFDRGAIHASGAGALYLRTDGEDGALVELAGVTDSFSHTNARSRAEAARKMRRQLPTGGPAELLCLGGRGSPGADAAETGAWRDWTGSRRAPRRILGEAFAASAAWQCVAACDSLQRGEFTAANVSVVGANQQAIGARFIRAAPSDR
jgi:hypothetical protein